MALPPLDDVVVLGVERDRADHRAEDLLAHDLHVGRGVGEHGRLDEVPAVAHPAAAGRRVGAGVHARGHVAEHLLVLLGGDQRPHLGVGVEPLADLDLPGLVGDPLDDLVIDLALDVQARARAAALALVEEDAVGRTRDRDLQVGVLEEHLRALAAQLERDLLQVARGRLHDQLADLGRAGEGDLVDAVVGSDRRAGVSEAGHDVDHAVREPGLHHQLTESQRRQRRLLGGLEHDGAPAASAGPSFQAAISSGKFHGMICPTTPTGSLRV